MNIALKKTALFVRDLLSYDEALIRIGRNNSEIEDLEENYIAVDTIGAAQRLASGEKFDDENETMTYGQQWRVPVTVTFYGADAWDNATKFSVLIKSQLAFDLQTSLAIGVFQASQLTDVKILTGQQYGNRVELALNVQLSVSAEVATQYLESVEIELNHEQSKSILPFKGVVNVTDNLL